MRISDWSSDVCSSDLVGASAGIAAADDPMAYDAQALFAAAGAALHSAKQAGRDTVRIADPFQAHAAAIARIARIGRRAGYESNFAKRSEERRVGKECGSTCKSGGAPDH